MIDLKNLRKSADHMSQTELAQLANVNRTTISFIENGRIVPSVKVAKKIADVFGIDWKVFYND